MSNITFTYNIIATNEQARCMEVVYTAEGKETMIIGTRLPYEGESLSDVILAYAPISYWKEKEMPVVVPEVGHTDVITVVEISDSSEVTTPVTN